MSMRSWTTATSRSSIPRLARDGPRITAYYELKANITLRADDRLSRAGIKKIQPGIESLDTEVLKLMRKGCTMLQNVQTLKLAAENGLFVEWNLLHGFPGETAESYRRSRPSYRSSGICNRPPSADPCAPIASALIGRGRRASDRDHPESAYATFTRSRRRCSRGSPTISI